MIRGGDTLFLELGPHPALKSSIEECLSVAGAQGTVLHSLKRKTDETENILANLAALHLHGVTRSTGRPLIKVRPITCGCRVIRGIARRIGWSPTNPRTIVSAAMRTRSWD